ncbi:MAG: hypothetical protein V1919_03025 [Candidatus Omnitrophota bacterium]
MPKPEGRSAFPKPRGRRPRAGKPASGTIGRFSLEIFSDAKRPNRKTTSLDVLRALIETEGSQSAAKKKLPISLARVGQIARKTYRMTRSPYYRELIQSYADKLGVSVDDIKIVCSGGTLKQRRASKITSKDNQILQALFKHNGSKEAAETELGINLDDFYGRAKEIRYIHPELLGGCADKLGISVQDIKNICYDFLAQYGGQRPRPLKQNYIEILQTLFETDGNQMLTAKKLKKQQTDINQIAIKIYKLCQTNPELIQPYAGKLGISVDDIKNICDGRAAQRMRTAKRRMMKAK